MNREQILALAEEQGAVANLKQHFNMAGDSIVFTPEELEAFLNAAIESYKAEFLKEVGEPVAEIIDAVQTPGYFYVKRLGAYIPQGTKLYTAPPQPDDVRDAWQPIETAPKDEVVLAWIEYRDLSCARVGSFDLAGGFHIDGNARCTDCATHWIPLPEAPAIAAAKGEV